jgi:hypothetical protein
MIHSGIGGRAVFDGAVLSAEAHITRRLETQVGNWAISSANIALCGYVLSESIKYDRVLTSLTLEVVWTLAQM